ncbi:glycosyltransferase [Simiduia litorea]|uniref:glycosyltransferase n=1 Tax=Simiduia litorea TaxID=1435348 RepID=UPI0036F3FC53
MKIVLLVDALHSIGAGSERQIYKLLEGLKAQGLAVELVLLRHTPFTRALENFPCPISCLDISSILSVSAWRKMRQLRRRLIDEHVAAVHAWLPDSCLLAPLTLKHKRFRIITSRRDMGLIYDGKPALLFSLLSGRTDTVIANSKAVAALVKNKENLPAQKIRVVYNGIEDFVASDETLSAPQIFDQANAIKLILVANIKPVKRTLDAVKATIQLNRDGQATQLALVGERQDKAYCHEIETYIRDNNAQACIHWVGSIKEPRLLLAQADIGLLVSDSEGLSNTLMEYMQMGLATIATEVGGNPELIRHNENGLLIPKGDIDALQNAVRTLSNNKDLRERFGAVSQQRIEKDFSISAMIAQSLHYYQADARSHAKGESLC